MRLTKFKTKLIFTLGIYLFVWRHQVATWLRDDFKAPLDPGREVLSMFIPIYGLVVLWRFLQTMADRLLDLGVTRVLIAAIEQYMQVHNDEPKPLLWTADDAHLKLPRPAH